MTNEIAGRKKVEIRCPECGETRLVNAQVLCLPTFTGMCLRCWGYVNGGCHSQEQRRKIARSLIKHTEVDGADTQSAGCRSIHKSLRLWYGKPNHCENNPSHIAKNNRYDRANLPGVYTRNIDDYASLCPSCHKRYDAGRIKIRGLFKHERMVLNGIAR